MSKVVFFGGAYTDSNNVVKTSDAALYSSSDSIVFTKSSAILKNSTLTQVGAIGACFAFFNQKWITFGGGLASDTDILTSDDLVTWTATPFQSGQSVLINRDKGILLVFDNKLWVIGGTSSSSYAAGWRPGRIYNSSDGLTWTMASTVFTSTSSTDNRFQDGRALAANGKMYLMAFREGSATTVSNKIYHSTTGTSWSSVTAQWSARSVPTVNYINGTFVLIGGIGSDNTTKIADLWTSTDGLVWTQRTYPSIFPAGGIANANTYEMDGKMVIFGGDLPSIYSTTDGINWVVENPSPPIEISSRKYVMPALEGIVAAKIQGSASSTSNMKVTLAMGDLLVVNLSGGSTSTVSMSAFEIPQIAWINLMNAISNSFGMVASGVVYPSILRTGTAQSNSSVNMVIEFIDVSTHVLKGNVTIGGSPIQNATVIAVNQDNPSYSYKTTTDTNGDYSLICSRNGNYVLVCFYQNVNGTSYTAFAKPYIQIGVV